MLDSKKLRIIYINLGCLKQINLIYVWEYISALRL